MVSVSRLVALALSLVAAPTLVWAEPVTLVEHSVGKPDAPIKVDEYASVTCSHCADFYIDTMPKLQKKYIDTGLVRFVMHDFPLGSLSLKAAAVAQCMPKEQYFAFLKTMYISLLDGTLSNNGENQVYQYAALGGLPLEKAKECASDKKLQEALLKDRTEAEQKYNIDSTPTFVINDGAAIIQGAQSFDAFAAELDRILGKSRSAEKKGQKAESKK